MAQLCCFTFSSGMKTLGCTGAIDRARTTQP